MLLILVEHLFDSSKRVSILNMVVKRECDAAAEQQPAAEEQPAAKARRTGAHCEDNSPHSMPLAAEAQAPSSMPLAAEAQACAQTATPNATMAPQAAAELPKATGNKASGTKSNSSRTRELTIPSRPLTSWAHRQKNTLKYAESHMTYWWKVVQREKMQLQAHLDGNRRVEELQLEEVKNKDGVVIGHIDPDPDIDRLHIKVWSPDSEKYICFLDSKSADTIAKLKQKIEEHPDVVHMISKDMIVFWNGVELVDTDTLDEKWIHDDCILHVAVGNVYDAPIWVVKCSAELNQWRLLLPPNLKPPARNKVASTRL